MNKLKTLYIKDILLSIFISNLLITLFPNDAQAQDPGDTKVVIASASAPSYQTGHGIRNSYDGNRSTYYHSHQTNTGANYFPIRMTYSFTDVPRIDYLIYCPRTDGHVSGNFKEFDLYVATKSEPTLKFYGTYDFAGRGYASSITFFEPLIDPIQIQFVVKSGAGAGKGFVSCAEMEFYEKQKKDGSKFGDFPYFQSFLGNVKPDEITLPIPSTGTNSAEFSPPGYPQGLLLTPNSTAEFGAVFVNDRKFNSKNGIIIEFEYMAYGGTGADGLGVFFFNAAVDDPKIGAKGAGIGYTYRRANYSNLGFRRAGLTGAYLGVALDSYGNFKTTRWIPSERIAGINQNGGERSHVTLRGATGDPYPDASNILAGMGVGFTGYPVLVSQSTKRTGVNEYYYLNENGNYISMTSNPAYDGDFVIRGEHEFTDDSSPFYRKAIIELYPVHPEQSEYSGIYVTVKIQHGKTITTVIDDYEYKSKFLYRETAVPNHVNGDDWDPSTPVISSPIELNAAIPEFLRVGFSASTGESTDIHIVRNLLITLPGSAESDADHAITYMGNPVTIQVLDNDIAYDGIISRQQVGKKENLDPETFIFITSSGNVLGKGEFEYISENEGVWRYNPVTEGLTFTPEDGFSGEAVIYYSIKGGLPGNEDPYKDEAYRSVPAKVSVTVIDNSENRQYIRSNRMIAPQLK